MAIEGWRAAWYMAHLGYRIFPTRSGGKQPRKRVLEHGTVDDRGRGSFYVATTEASKIKFWAETIPEANYAIATGGNVTVIDLDRHSEDQNGIEVFDSLCQECGNCTAQDIFDQTFVVSTPSDGLHVYFYYFTAKSRTLMNGIEIQNHGRYVVGPGSCTPNGCYTTNDEPVEPEKLLVIPDWLWQVVNGKSQISGINTSANKRSIQQCLIESGQILKGERHDAVYAEISLMLQHDELSQQETFDKIKQLIHEHIPNPQDFTDGEIKRNIKNVLRYMDVEPESWLWDGWMD